MWGEGVVVSSKFHLLISNFYFGHCSSAPLKGKSKAGKNATEMKRLDAIQCQLDQSDKNEVI